LARTHESPEAHQVEVEWMSVNKLETFDFIEKQSPKVIKTSADPIPFFHLASTTSGCQQSV